MNIIRCSESIEGFLGYSCEDLTEKRTATIRNIFLYDTDRIRNTVLEIFSGSRPFNRKGEIKMVTRESEEKLVNLTFYPLMSKNEITAVEIIIENITEIKSLKEKINSINRIQLLQDITKGFLHSLNNSINIIMSQTQLLLQITEKESVLDGIHIIERSALDIVDNIRRVQNSIAKKSYFYEERTAPLVNIIEDAIEFSRMQFKVEDKEKKRNIQIDKKYFTSVNIRIDTGLLREIIISIILKVSAFIRKKGIIEISLKDNNDLMLAIKVNKEDRNIDTLHLQKMVNVFSGIDIRQAAEKINIKIIEEESAESYAIRAVFPQRLITDKLNLPPTEPDIKLRDLDIIIVEDEKALKKILFEIFDRMGTRVFICENGIEALEEFRRKHYDIVITDYGIPGITGIELAVRVKELREDVLTVLLSGWTLEGLTAYRSIVDMFMPKPFKLDDLINSISQVHKEKRKQNDV
jgi:CheY-like chemotaxis protein